MFAGEDVARAAHVGGQLVDLVEAAVDHLAAQLLLAQVADDEVVRLGGREGGELEVDTANPEALALEAAHKMAADESPGAANQRSFRFVCHVSVLSLSVGRWGGPAARVNAVARASVV